MSAETLKSNETDTYQAPGEAGHNKEVVWERWQKKRTFVRALEGTYGEVYKELFAAPRVYPSLSSSSFRPPACAWLFPLNLPRKCPNRGLYRGLP